MVSHYIPKTLEDALTQMAETPYTIMAGGTDLMVKHRAWSEIPPAFKKPLMFIFNLEELKMIKKEKDRLRIGAMTPLETMLYHKDIPSLLKKVISVMAGPGIRQVSTLAGNIANASPAGDSLVALYALDAVVVLKSKKASREVAIEDLITGPGQTVIKEDELIKEIVMPLQNFSQIQFKKIGGRQADAISKVAFAGLITVNHDRVTDFRITLNAVAARLIRSRDFEASLQGKTIQEIRENIDAICAHYETLIKPIDDQRSTKFYRKNAALRLIREFIEML